MAQAYLQQILKKDTTAGEMTDFLFSNGDKVGCGKFPPKFAREGEYYEYGITEKGNYKNLTSGSFKAIPKPAGVEAPPKPAPATATSYGRGGDTQKVISRQAAANTAVSFVNLLASNDALPIPKAAKGDKKADLMELILRDYMQKFHKWSTGEDFDFGKDDTGSDLNLKDLEDPEEWNE